MNYVQTFLIEGKFLGAVSREPVLTHAEYHAPMSYAYFCPHCAEVWARCPVQSQRGQEPFQVWTIPCRSHYTDILRVPGSLFLTWDKPFNDSFPVEVIRRELLLLLDNYERTV